MGDTINIAEIARQSGEVIHAKRSEAVELLAEARATGRKKDTRSIEAAIRQYDKLISTYGLDRYAPRS